MQVMGLRRFGKAFYIAAILGVLLLASAALSAVTADVAYAGGRQPNIVLTKDTKTVMNAKVNLTMPSHNTSASQSAYSENGQVTLGKKTYEMSNQYKKEPKVKNLKNSKKSVATIEFNPAFKNQGKYYGHRSFRIVPKKPGKTTISFKVASGSVTKTVKLNVTVHKYDKALSSAKFGSLTLTKKLNQSESGYVSLTNKQFKGKLALKPAKGWKVQEATFWTYATSSNGYQQKSKALKSGKTYGALKSGYLYVLMKNKSDGRYRHITFALKNPSVNTTALGVASADETVKPAETTGSQLKAISL